MSSQVKVPFERRAEHCVRAMVANAQHHGYPPGEGVATVGAQSKQWDVSRTHARRILDRMVREGYLWCKKHTGAGAPSLGVMEYRLTEDCIEALGVKNG